MGQGDFNINLPDGENFAPSEDRVQAFAEMMVRGLSENFHLGLPGSDRPAWDRLRDDEVGRRILADAYEAAHLDPLPVVTDEIYLECLDHGSPASMNAVAPGSRLRMALLPIAECLEPDDRFMERIEQDIQHTLGLHSWIHPNNDSDRDTFEGRTIFNDLASTHTASLLVAADYLLGDRLQPDTREGIRREVRRRTLDPFRQRIESGKDVYWWVTVTHNWNSVCLLHTVACALALLEDPLDRAWYVATAETLIRYSEDGFTESGFYTEGVSYWAYGFGCYVTLAEIVRTVTAGEVDWLQQPLVERMSHFGRHMEIQDGVFPSFADCRRDVDLPAWLVHWSNNRQDGSKVERSQQTPIDILTGNPFRTSPTALLVLFHQVDTCNAYAVPEGARLRDWWADEQFLICRPAADSPIRFASTFKGGDNGVNHNHNDLGTFTVLIGDRELLTDPGAEIYTERTFSSTRYEGDLLNSFGHPVPVVAGQLQPPSKSEYTKGIGTDVVSRVLQTDFSDEEDHVLMDLSGAYRVPSLESLTRNFTHCRTGDGVVTVIDAVRFSSPERFETALITYGEWSQRPDGVLRLHDGDSGIDVRVRCEEGSLEFDHLVIQESSTPTRLSWRLVETVTEASIRIEVRPAHD